MSKPVKTVIPEKHYLALSKKFNDLPFAHMVPYGTDAASKKRMSSLDSKDVTNLVMDNIPMMGFKITGVASRGGDGVADTWGLEDPRGFKHYIGSDNLEMLHKFVNIERGEIVDTCVWAREGGKNILLPTESDIYQNALTMTDIVSSLTSWKDIKPGYKITMQNGLTGRYIGKFFFIKDKKENVYKTNDIDNCVGFSTNKHHIIEIETTRKYPANLKTELVNVTNIKPSKIVDDSTEMSEKDSEVEINRLINDPTCYSRYNYFDTNYAGFCNPIKHYSLYFEKMSVSNSDYWKAVDSKSVFIRTTDDRVGMISMSEHSNSRKTATKIGVCFIHENELQNGILSFVKTKQESYYRREIHYTINTVMVDPSDVKEVLRLNIEFDTKLDNTFKIVI